MNGQSDPQYPLTNTIIYLIGFPGVGKLTVAKELVKLTSAKLCDAHAVNNLLFNVIYQDGKTPLDKRIWPKVRKIRDILLDTIKEISPKEYSFIFTNYLIENDEGDKACYENIKSVATERSCAFYPIALTCKPEEHKKRITSPDRKINMKDINADNVNERNTTESILRPNHPNFLEIDTTNLEPHDTALKIIDHIKEVQHA